MRYATKRDLLDDIERAHEALVAQLGEIPEERYAQEGVWGDGWTVTDLETPRLNRDIQARGRGRPWGEVWSEFEETHGRVVDLVRSLGEGQLLQPGHFDWTGQNPLATYVGPNTASHYRFGVRVLKRWRKAQEER